MSITRGISDGYVQSFLQADRLSLRIDADGEVVAVDDRFNAFLEQQRVASLAPVEVGAPFLASVEGGAAASLYELILRRARGRYRVSIDVVAASPTFTSKVELAVIPADPLGAVDLALRVLHRRPRSPIALFDPGAERGDDQVAVCGFCQRVRAFEWAEAERALRQLRVRSDGPQPQIRPDTCDDCERMVYANCGGSRLSW